MIPSEPKIIVEVYDQIGHKHTRKYPVEEHKVVFKKGHKGKGGAALKIPFSPDDVIPFKKGFPFKRLHLKLIYNEVAKQFINPRAKLPSDITLTWKDIEGYFQAQVIKAAGAVNPKIEIPMLLWLLVLAGVAFGLLNFLGVRI